MITQSIQILFWLTMSALIVVLSRRLVRRINRQADDLDTSLAESFERQRRRQDYEPSYARERFSRGSEVVFTKDRVA